MPSIIKTGLALALGFSANFALQGCSDDDESKIAADQGCKKDDKCVDNYVCATKVSFTKCMETTADKTKCTCVKGGAAAEEKCMGKTCVEGFGCPKEDKDAVCKKMLVVENDCTADNAMLCPTDLKCKKTTDAAACAADDTCKCGVIATDAKCKQDKSTGVCKSTDYCRKDKDKLAECDNNDGNCVCQAKIASNGECKKTAEGNIGLCVDTHGCGKTGTTKECVAGDASCKCILLPEDGDCTSTLTAGVCKSTQECRVKNARTTPCNGVECKCFTVLADFAVCTFATHMTADTSTTFCPSAKSCVKKADGAACSATSAECACGVLAAAADCMIDGSTGSCRSAQACTGVKGSVACAGNAICTCENKVAAAATCASGFTAAGSVVKACIDTICQQTAAGGTLGDACTLASFTAAHCQCRHATCNSDLGLRCKDDTPADVKCLEGTACTAGNGNGVCDSNEACIKVPTGGFCHGTPLKHCAAGVTTANCKKTANPAENCGSEDFSCKCVE